MKVRNLCGALLILGAFLLCAGCGDPTLDTSSDEAFSASLEKMYKSVPEAERESFRDYLNLTMNGKVPASFFGGGRKVPSYDEFIQMYSLVKAFGKEKDQGFMANINGLTRVDIMAKGQTILKTHLEARQVALNQQIAETQKKLDDYERLKQEPEKVEVICTGVDLIEGFYSPEKPWGSVGTIATLVTVKNNSSETIKRIGGKVVLSDGSDTPLGDYSLGGLRAIDYPDDNAYIDSLEIAPGTEWQGKVLWKFFGPNKNHPFPATKQYSASLSDVTVSLDTQMPNSFEMQMDTENLKRYQEALEAVEKELAGLQ